MTLIVDNDALAEFCDSVRGEEFITVDTEFMRERTFWPRLCLVQIAGPNQAVAVDALAPDIDLSPVMELMADTSILKVFHAARQDLEIFYNLTGRLPSPIFDTQIAAMVCGFGDAASYETLASKLARAKIDKSSRFTDWSARPLSEKQIAYALADVTHLRIVYQKLEKRIGKNGRAAWLREEMDTLSAPETYDLAPELAFRRIKVRSPKPRLLAILREVAAWREREARTRDLPRNHVLRDDALLEIAFHRPSTVADLARTRGLGKRMAEGSMGAALLEAVARGMEVPDTECPRPETKPQFPSGIGPTTELLKVLLKMKCEQYGVAQKLVACSSDLDALAAYGEEAEVPLLKGWRRELYGDDALKLCDGALALSVRNRHIVVLPAP